MTKNEIDMAVARYAAMLEWQGRLTEGAQREVVRRYREGMERTHLGESEKAEVGE